MNRKIGTAMALEPRFKSTASGHVAAGLAIPRPTRDPSVLVGFVAGVILTATAFIAAAPYLVHR
jgi:hypothetical protein